MQQGPYIDFIVKTSNQEHSSIIIKRNEKLQRLDINTMRVIKSQEVTATYGARSAIVVDGKLFVSYKNKSLYVYDSWSLKELFSVHTGIDIARVFHHFYDASQPSENTTKLKKSFIMMTIGVNIWVMDVATNEIPYKTKLPIKELKSGTHVIFGVTRYLPLNS